MADRSGKLKHLVLRGTTEPRAFTSPKAKVDPKRPPAFPPRNDPAEHARSLQGNIQDIKKAVMGGTMLDESNSRDSVLNDIEAMKEHAKSYSFDDIKSGEWFTRFLRYVMDTYAKKVNAEYFREKYPHLPADAIIDRRVELAKRYAALEGGVSAAAYSAAVVATLGSHGGASPIMVPAAVAAFMADLMTITKLQLNLAYDISVLYGHPVDLEDPEDLFDLVKVAFGVKAADVFQEAATRLAPEAVRQGVRRIATGATLAWLQALPVVGRYLLQRNLIKFAIPVVSVPLSSGFNHYFTGQIAGLAKQVYRDKAAIEEKTQSLAARSELDPLLVLKTLWVVVRADGRTEPQEGWLLDKLTRALAVSPEGELAVDEFKKIVELSVDDLLPAFVDVDDGAKRILYEAACYAAAVDHDIARKERAVLEKIATACGQEFDLDAIKKLAER